MNNIIKKVKNGGFEVVSTSYGYPIMYEYNIGMQSRLEGRRDTTHTTGYSYKYSFYRDNGC
jgi:hypothetical protein